MNRRVLVVDDDDGLAESLRFLLERKGFLAEKEIHPLRVYAKIRANVYDVILVDFVMGKYGGIDVLVDIPVSTFIKSTTISQLNS